MIKGYIKLIIYSFASVFILPIASIFLDKEMGAYVQEIEPETAFADLPVPAVPYEYEGGPTVNYNEIYYDGGCDSGGSDGDGGCDGW